MTTTDQTETGPEVRLLWITALIVAATRVWALSRSMWEWDEVLFSAAVQEYDVAIHHPHPPGYPLFILLANALRLVVHSDFRALQGVVLLGAVTLFPLAFFLARELRFTFATSYLGALLFVFAPNVWYFGGTAFSDVPGTAMILAACIFLLRGSRDARAYLLGALLLGLAAGFRPQSLLAGAVPALIATWHQWRASWRRVVAAILLGATVMVGTYAGAVLASASPRAFVDAVEAQQKWVERIDSYRNPIRTSLAELFQPFFVRAISAGDATARNLCLLALMAVAASAVQRRTRTWLLLAMFLPLNIFSWLMLDAAAASRYAISYAILYALLVAESIRVLSQALKHARLSLLVQSVMSASVIVYLAWWTLPALLIVRKTSAPSAAAMEWVTKNLDRSKARIHVFEGLSPFAIYYLRGWDVRYEKDPAFVAAADPAHKNDWFLTDRASRVEGAVNFVRPHDRIWDIARQRYFEFSVAPIIPKPSFGRGWYDEEGAPESAWRWMGSRAEILLPPVDGRVELTLEFFLPLDTVPPPATVSFRWNGELLDRMVCTELDNRRTLRVETRAGVRNELVIETDRVANLKKLGTGKDERDLGLRLNAFAWEPDE